jgi:hypothetical protein
MIGIHHRGMIDATKLQAAVDYANRLLGCEWSMEWGEEALGKDFSRGMARTWVWGAVVRAHYDAISAK